MRLVLTLVAAFVALTACGAGERTASLATARDSAGITIVESTAPAWTEATSWRVAAAPSFDIGGSERDTLQQFSAVRGVHRLPGGTVAVVDAGSSSIRFYESN